METIKPDNLPEVVYRSLYWCRVNPCHKELVQEIQIILHSGQQITIPAGFQTDLATVPRMFWSVVAPSGGHDLAVIVHDYLLEHGFSRKFADEEMRRWLKLSGVGYVQRSLIYRAVRLYAGIKSLKSGRILKE